MSIDRQYQQVAAPKKAKLKSLEDLRALVPAVAPRKAVAPPIEATVAPPGKLVAPPGERPGRMAPKANLRMHEDEWDALDRLRGSLSRNDAIRALIMGADRITGGQ